MTGRQGCGGPLRRNWRGGRQFWEVGGGRLLDAARSGGGGVLCGREQEGCAQLLGLGGYSASHGGAKNWQGPGAVGS